MTKGTCKVIVFNSDNEIFMWVNPGYYFVIITYRAN